VDTTTACAVHLDDAGRLTSRHIEQLTELLEEFERGRGRVGLRAIELTIRRIASSAAQGRLPP